KSFEIASGESLKSFFDQWITRKGGPLLEISDISVVDEAQYFILKFSLSQKQNEDIFIVNIPVAIYLKDHKEVIIKNVVMDKRMQEYSFVFDKKPLKIEVDPQFNIFRRLDYKEVPPAFSQIFGSKQTLLVLPSKSDHLYAYRALANEWKNMQEVQGKKFEIVMDSSYKKLPSDRTLWILGFENKFTPFASLPDAYDDYLRPEKLEKVKELSSKESWIYVIPNPWNETEQIGFLGSNNAKAIPGLTRKLPHYGKYSFLGFEGSAPDNVLKGSFPSLNSPLHVWLVEEIERKGVIAELIMRKALPDSQ
ncbi:hypothetical protein ACFL6I_28415, partial [candidate division KSB1 bacterium]